MRKISYSIYLAAFVISALIFISGVFVGSLIDNSNLETLSSEVNEVSGKVSSLQLLLLMEGNSSSFCPVYSSELQSIDEQVEILGHKLSYLEDQKGAEDPELKNEYFALQAESYLLSKKVNEICGSNNVLLIHFYSNKDCEMCAEQGIQVLEARDGLRGEVPVKLYSFDGELGSPIVDAFKKSYSVKKYPTLVINGKTYPGYKSVEEIKQILRESYDS